MWAGITTDTSGAASRAGTVGGMTVGYRPFHGRPHAARGRERRQGRGDRRRVGRRAAVGHHVRRARGARQPPRPRVPRARGRRGERIAWCGAELARGDHHPPRQPQGRAHVGPGLVPIQRRRDAVRDRQLRRDRRARRRRAGIARGSRCATSSRRSAACWCSAATRPPAARSGTSSSPRNPTRRRSTPRARGGRGRGDDDLHVGHHRQAEGRDAHRHRRRRGRRAARRARPPGAGPGARHHRPALPLGSAVVRVVRACASAGPSWCCASSTRRRGYAS